MSLVEYPGAYLAGVAAQLIVYSVDMLIIFVVVWNFGTLAGWLPMEVIFIFATWLLSYAIGATFTFNIAINFREMAIRGTLDEAYTRPMPPFLYLISTHINLAYVAHVTVTVVALAISIVQLNITWTALQWIWLAVMIGAGAIIQGCMLLLCNMLALRTRSESPTIIFWTVNFDFIRYPISIYPRFLQIIFTAILPYAFISFYPAQVLLGKQDGIFANVTMWLSPVVAVLLIGITALCWSKVAEGYESAGT